MALVGDRMTRDAVPAAADRNRQALRPGRSDGRRDLVVVSGSTMTAGRRSIVRVEDLTRVVVVGVVRQDDAAIERRSRSARGVEGASAMSLEHSLRAFVLRHHPPVGS